MATPRDESVRDTPQSKRKKTGHGLNCAVGGCSNEAGDGITLHTFPKDEALRRKWTKFVQLDRADFGPKYGTPNQYSAICHEHFAVDCYPQSYALMNQLGFTAKRNLIYGSVPTIRPSPVAKTSRATASQSRVNTVSVSVPVSVGSPTTSTTMAITSPVCSSILPGVKNIRRAYVKRECARITATILPNIPAVIATESMAEPDENELPEPTLQEQQMVNSMCQTDPLPIQKRPEQKKKDKTFRSKNTQATIRPPRAHVGVQCRIYQTTNSYTQCNLELEHKPDQVAEIETEMESLLDHDLSDLDHTVDDDDHMDLDESYHPSSPATSTTDEGENSPLNSPCKTVAGKRSRKFIVFEEKLLELFSRCWKCSGPALPEVAFTKDSLVKLVQHCGLCNSSHSWYSQPFVRDIPAGNLLISSAIVLSGSSTTKVLRFLQHMGISSITDDAVQQHQKGFLQPVVRQVWQAWQERYYRLAQQKPVTLGGDGRADSPGHTAKYGTYSLMDLDLMQICNVQLVQSNEVENSGRMELEGLKNALKDLKQNGVTIQELVTDRHPQILKHIADLNKTKSATNPSIKHTVDVWHVAKGLKKKLVKLSREKECGNLGEWIRSIVNHMYWVAASTPSSNRDVMVAKWTSLSNHIHNRHHHEGTHFPKCLHPPHQKKKWLKEGSKVSVKLVEQVNSKRLVKDVGMLATGPQTAALESFHSVLNHFTPKMLHFPYPTMLLRTTVAAMHFNENRMREQTMDREGNKRFFQGFKKAKGGFTLQEVKEDPTFRYVEILTDSVMEMASSIGLKDAVEAEKEREKCPPPLASSFVKPSKEDAVANLQSRYKLN